MYEGQHASIFTGHGVDFEDQVDYQPGDDVGSIDLKSSARAGHPIIRRFERDSDVFTQLVLDTGRHMAAVSPSGECKSDIALFAADVLAYLAAHRGDRLGLVYGTAEAAQRMAARHGTQHLEFLLERARHAYADDAAPANVSSLLEHVLRTTRQRSLVVLVTDETWPNYDDEFTLRRIRTRHELIVVQVANMQMTAEGVDHMVDIDDRVDLPAFVRDDRVLREQVMRTHAAAREVSDQLLQTHNVRAARVSASDDVLPALFTLLRRQHHGR